MLPGFGLTFGFTTFFLSAIVLIPLAALVSMAGSMHWDEFIHTVLSARALASYRLSFGASLVAATINLVFGFILPGRWCAMTFPAANSSTRSSICRSRCRRPFPASRSPRCSRRTVGWAVPGAGGHQGGLHLDRRHHRTDPDRHAVHGAHVQPALAEVQRELEDAAEILGAGRFYVFRRIILPTVLPAMLTGFALAFARGVGEYGSVIFIAGNLPFKTEITPLLIVIRLDEFDYHGAAALGCVMLSISFLGLWAINYLQHWGRRRPWRAGADGRRTFTIDAGGTALPPRS